MGSLGRLFELRQRRHRMTDLFANKLAESIKKIVSRREVRVRGGFYKKFISRFDKFLIMIYPGFPIFWHRIFG